MKLRSMHSYSDIARSSQGHSQQEHEDHLHVLKLFQGEAEVPSGVSLCLGKLGDISGGLPPQVHSHVCSLMK